jgi:hypothetical protein
LTQVDVDRAGTVGSDGREQVVLVEPDESVFEFLAVPSEEDGSSSRSVTYSEGVTFE